MTFLRILAYVSVVLVGGMFGGLGLVFAGAIVGAYAEVVCYGCGLPAMIATIIVLVAVIVWGMTIIAGRS